MSAQRTALVSSYLIPLTLAAVGAVVHPRAAAAEADSLFARATLAARERGGTGDPRAQRRGEMPPSHHVELKVTLEARECVVAAAAIDSGSNEVELSIKTPEGLSLTDAESGSLARLRYCAGATKEEPTIRVHAAARSPFALGVWSVQLGAAVVSPPATSAPIQPAAPRQEPSAPPTLPLRLVGLARATASELEAMTPPREEDLDAREPRKRDVALEQERCYRLLAVSEDLSDVSLTLVDPAGVPLAEQQGDAEGVVLGAPEAFCPKHTGLYAVRIAAGGGSGRVLWQMFGKPNPELASRWAVGGSASSLVAKRVRSAHDQRDENKAPASPLFTGTLKTAEDGLASFEVKSGLCYVAIAAAVPSMRSLDLEMLDQRGNVVASVKDQGGSARISACADLNARWTVRVRAFKGYGEYGVQVFSGL